MGHGVELRAPRKGHRHVGPHVRRLLVKRAPVTVGRGLHVTLVRAHGLLLGELVDGVLDDPHGGREVLDDL